MEAVLAFGATLVAVRLSAELIRRFRTRRRPEFLAWGAALAAYGVAAGALAWGAAAGWGEAAFRVYYLGGALLTAPLLGAGSLLLVGRRWAAPLALVYAGLAIGVALAVPLETSARRDRRSRRRRTCSSSGPRGFSRSRATRSGRRLSSSSRWRASGADRSGMPSSSPEWESPRSAAGSPASAWARWRRSSRLPLFCSTPGSCLPTRRP